MQSRTVRLIMSTQDTSIPESISELQTQLEQVSLNASETKRLPVSLWQWATELARQHGIYAVARSLRLDFMQSKNMSTGLLRFEAASSPYPISWAAQESQTPIYKVVGLVEQKELTHISSRDREGCQDN